MFNKPILPKTLEIFQNLDLDKLENVPPFITSTHELQKK